MKLLLLFLNVCLLLCLTGCTVEELELVFPDIHIAPHRRSRVKHVHRRPPPRPRVVHVHKPAPPRVTHVVHHNSPGRRPSGYRPAPQRPNQRPNQRPAARPETRPAARPAASRPGANQQSGTYQMSPNSPNSSFNAPANKRR